MELVQQQVSDGIRVIAMNRPDKRNALSAEMVAALRSAFAEADVDPETKVVILKGHGPAFCAGADLSYLQKISENSPQENLADSMALMEMMQSIVDCSKPVIAMVHGPAIAGGCGLATVCDIVIAGEERAQFGYSEVKIGFIPAIVMVYLLRKVGDTQTRRLVLTAQNITAREAERIGLITFVAPDVELEQQAMRLAGQIAGNSSSAMALSKEMMSTLHGMSLDAGLRYAASMNALARQTADCKAGIARFLSQTK
jgi:methylglutaconyl-CoA hydratase